MKTRMNVWSRLGFAAGLALAGAGGAAAAAGVARDSAGASSPTAAAGEDIRDIRGPKPVPDPWLWAWWLAGGAALTVPLYLVWRRWGRRPTAGLLPFQIALARLEEARKWMQPEDAREFSIEVSEIVRTYIAARFQVEAGQRTTEEFLHDLLAMPEALLGSHRTLLADFLHHCDLAKFARWVLSYEQMERMLLSALDFVLATGQPQLEVRPDRATSSPLKP